MAQKGAEITDWVLPAAREMRVVKFLDTKRVAVRFAVACARRALPRYEKDYPGDKRVRAAVEAAEAYLKDPSKANRSAASAAWSAARSAACSADRSSWSAGAAAFVARSVKSRSSAAWFAAECAAWSAAESAAWSAARSAACSADRSSWSAAAESAAWSAWSAERQWQNMTLKSFIEEEYS